MLNITLVELKRVICIFLIWTKVAIQDGQHFGIKPSYFGPKHYVSPLYYDGWVRRYTAGENRRRRRSIRTANGAARMWIEPRIYAWHVERVHALRQGLQLLALLKFSQANSTRLVVITRYVHFLLVFVCRNQMRHRALRYAWRSVDKILASQRLSWVLVCMVLAAETDGDKMVQRDYKSGWTYRNQ